MVKLSSLFVRSMNNNENGFDNIDSQWQTFSFATHAPGKQAELFVPGENL